MTPGSQEWMHLGEPGESGFPVTGGYEEYSEVRWRSPGWKENYAVARISDHAVKLTATLADGRIYPHQKLAEWLREYGEHFHGALYEGVMGSIIDALAERYDP